MIKHGAGISTCNEQGSLPLHIAAAAGNYAAVHALIKYANPEELEQTDAACWTPLHTAAFRGFAQWMRYPQLMIVHMSAEGYEGEYYRTLARLMAAEADLTAQTQDDQSLAPYQLARMLGPEELACYVYSLRIFWDTCNGECFHDPAVLHPSFTWLEAPPSVSLSVPSGSGNAQYSVRREESGPSRVTEIG